MKRITIVGLCLVATFALSAMVASVAQAAQVGVCVKAGKTVVTYEGEMIRYGKPVFKEKTKSVYNGGYSNNVCTSSAPSPGLFDGESPKVIHTSYKGPEGKYEWYPGLSGAPADTFKYTAKTAKVHLGLPGTSITVLGESTPEAEVNCTSSTAVGKWTGSETGEETITLKGCVLTNVNRVRRDCASEGMSPGEIETSPLDFSLLSYPDEMHVIALGSSLSSGELQYYDTPVAENSVNLEYSAAPGHPYAEYQCGGALIRTQGTPIGHLLTGNTMGKVKTSLGGWTDLYSEYSGNGGESYQYIGPVEASTDNTATEEAGKVEIQP